MMPEGSLSYGAFDIARATGIAAQEQLRKDPRDRAAPIAQDER
jgi:hypothetical protein